MNIQHDIVCFACQTNIWRRSLSKKNRLISIFLSYQKSSLLKHIFSCYFRDQFIEAKLYRDKI